MNHRRCFAPPARGLSLVELMVALVLGLLVAGFLLQLFVASKITYNVTDGMARAQESARYAMTLLSRDLRMAGAPPMCSGEEPELRNLVAQGSNGDVGFIINAGGFFGLDYDGTETGPYDFPLNGGGNTAAGQWGSFDFDGLPPALVGRVLAGTDVLGMSSMMPVPDITGCTNNNANQTALNVCDANDAQAGHPIGMGEIVVAVDCVAGVGDVFANNTVGQAGNQPLNRSAGLNNSGVGNVNVTSWSTAFRENTEIYRNEVVYYFIGESAGSTAERFRPALFRVRNCNTQDNCIFEELAEGVENMQIFFRRRGSNNLFTARNFPGPWTDVSAVEVDLITVSPEEVDSRSLSQSLTLSNGLVVSMDDRRIRLVYSNTSALRNRVVVR
jgi:type IV pilus assembly protein PilW